MPILPEVPDYVGMAHPSGMDRADLQAIFLTESAPRPDALLQCDGNFQKLKKASNSFDEVQRGALEMVSADPVKYHWCFYYKMTELDSDLSQTVLLKERQRIAIASYFFLAPIAKAFRQEFNDTRYLRWAMQNFQKMSEWLFYRRLDITPQAKNEWLSGLEGPISLTPKDFSGQSIMQKYSIKENPVAKPLLKSNSAAGNAATEALMKDPVMQPLQTESAPSERAPASTPPSPADSKAFEEDLFAEE